MIPGLDPRQKRISDLLGRLVSPGAVAFFEDSCQMMDGKDGLRCSAHLIAHSIREIESAIRAVLQPVVGPFENQNSVYEQHAAELVTRLEISGARSPEAIAGIVQLLNNIKPERPSHRDEIRQILKALAVVENDPIANRWLKLAGDLHKWAHRKNLDAPREVDEEFRDFWDQMQAVLDFVLHRMEGQYSAFSRACEPMLDKEEPTKEDIKLLREHVPNTTILGAFLDRLQKPGWVHHLAKGGFFSVPPRAISIEGEGIIFPPWPASRYLARMAKTASRPILELITSIVLDLPETGNERVLQDLVEIANGLPPDLAARLAEKAITWLTPYAAMVPSGLGAFAAKLAREGHAAEAILIMEQLLTVDPDPEYDPGKE